VSDDLVPAAVIERMTGYRQPAAQLAELHRQGFWRARRLRTTGKVVLERPHFEAVSSGADAQFGRTRQPKLAPP